MRGLEGLDDSEQFPTNNADKDSETEIAEVIKGVGWFADFLDFRDADFVGDGGALDDADCVSQ